MSDTTIKYTANDLATMLLNYLGCNETGGSREHVVAFEIQRFTGYSTRRLDAVSVNCFSSKGLAVSGYEIKISKADLRSELQDTSKSSEFFSNLDYFNLLCPAEIVDMSLIPKHWGVLVPNGKGSLRAKRKPLSLHESPITSFNKSFAASLLRAMNGQSPYLRAIREKVAAGYKKGFDEGMKRANPESKHLKEKLQRYELLDKYIPLWQDDEKSIKELAHKMKLLQSIDASCLLNRLNSFKDTLDKAITDLQQKFDQFEPTKGD